MESSKSSEAKVETVDVHVAKDLIQSGYRYLDVRTEDEVTKGPVKGAVNIPYWFFTPKGKMDNPKFMEKVLANFNKDDNIVVACASGARSIRAATDLVNAGFKHVKNMKGGYDAWVQKTSLVNKIRSNL